MVVPIDEQDQVLGPHHDSVLESSHRIEEVIDGELVWYHEHSLLMSFIENFDEGLDIVLSQYERLRDLFGRHSIIGLPCVVHYLILHYLNLWVTSWWVLKLTPTSTRQDPPALPPAPARIFDWVP